MSDWSPPTDILSDIYFSNLFDIYSDMLSNMFPDIWFDMLAGINCFDTYTLTF